jgi:hypothetical protein
MDKLTHGLAWLLYPRAVSEFFADYWERGPLILQHRGADYYEGLLTNRELEDIISSPDARYPAIRLARGGWFHPPEAYTRDVHIGFVTFHGVPDVDRISAEYGKGATITLPALHRSWQPLLRLCARLEAELDHTVHGNAYLTPGRAAGFPPHYDTHDILVLQIAGRKHWRIDAPTVALPHDTQTCDPHSFTPGPRLAELELRAGDLLYLPRGYTHSTTTGEGYSAHVTIGINIYSWVDLLAGLVPAAAEREELRHALPLGFASRPELRPTISQQLMRLLPELPAGTDVDQLLDQLIRRILPGRLRLPERFRTDAIVIAADSLLRAPEERRYSLTHHPAGVTLLFDGRTYIFPPSVRPILEAMTARDAFRLGEFPEAQQIDALLGFARYLQGIGFLQAAL